MVAASDPSLHSFAPNGPSGSMLSTMIGSTSGDSTDDGLRYSSMPGFISMPSFQTISSVRACPMPIQTEPMIWPSTETGFSARPQSCAAQTLCTVTSPVSVEGQIIGSVWMGMGQALTEEMVWKDGLLMNPGLLEYRSPSSVESPEVEPIIVESIDPEGPFGAKECSEGSLAATIPAIANAIYDAVGIRLHEAPFTPERVLAALRAKKNTKPLNLTEGVDPTAPTRFREHGGAVWFKGKGAERVGRAPSPPHGG